MAHLSIKCDRVFNYSIDDTAIKIIMLDKETFVWLQYGPTEGGLGVDVMKVYNEHEIRSMVEFFEPLGSIEALELFDKFLNLQS
jgi:deoxyxylulose-5-phosphate synthase